MTMMTQQKFSQQVRDIISNNSPTQKEHAEPKQWLRNYMIWSHSLMRASVPLMKAAAQYEGPAQSYYKRHIIEETHHDEWLLDDMKYTDIQNALSLQPSQGMAELVGSQYYWVHHWSSVCLLGYIGVIEGNPPVKTALDKLKELTGFPDEAFRTMYKHSDLDVKHKADLDDVLDSIPLDVFQKKWVLANAEYTVKKLKEIRNIT